MASTAGRKTREVGSDSPPVRRLLSKLGGTSSPHVGLECQGTLLPDRAGDTPSNGDAPEAHPNGTASCLGTWSQETPRHGGRFTEARQVAACVGDGGGGETAAPEPAPPGSLQHNTQGTAAPTEVSSAGLRAIRGAGVSVNVRHQLSACTARTRLCTGTAHEVAPQAQSPARGPPQRPALP